MSPKVLDDEVRITQNDPNVTLTAGTADTDSVIAEFICPDRTAFKIRPGDIFSVYLANSVPTEVGDKSKVIVRHTDPNGIVRRDVAQADYVAVKEFQDRNKLFTFGAETQLRPKDKLQIIANASVVVATAQTRFQVSTRRGAVTII